MEPAKIKKRKSVKGILKQVQRLLIEEGRWTQAAYVLGSERKHRFLDELAPGEAACKFCLIGAVESCAANPALANAAGRELKSALRQTYPRSAPISLVNWNDAHSRSRSEVARVIDAALKS